MSPGEFIAALIEQLDLREPTAEDLFYESVRKHGEVRNRGEFADWLNALPDRPLQEGRWKQVHRFRTDQRRKKAIPILNLVAGPSTETDLNERSHIDLVATRPFPDGSPAQVRQEGSLYAIGDANGVCFQDVSPSERAGVTTYYSLDLRFSNAAEAREFLRAIPAGYCVDDARIAGEKVKSR